MVLHGTHSSTVNISINKINKHSTLFTKKTQSQLVGHLLGDGFLTVTRTSVTPYFVFAQTIHHFDYM